MSSRRTAAVLQAAIFLSKNNFPGKVFVISLLDLPFSISPVVTGGRGGGAGLGAGAPEGGWHRWTTLWARMAACRRVAAAARLAGHS